MSSGLARRPFAIAGALLCAGIVGYGLLPRDETRIAQLLNALCAQLNQTRDEASLAQLQRFMRGALRPEVELHATELVQDLAGIDAVSAQARELLSLPPLTFAWSSMAVHLSGRLARVDADLLVTVRGSGEQHRDLRRTRVRLAKIDSAWQIEAVEIEAVAPSEPEARP